MAPKMKEPTQAEIDAFGDTPDEPGMVEVGFKLPVGISAAQTRQIMQAVKQLAEKAVRQKHALDLKKEEYQKDGHRRFKCMVEGTIEGQRTFQLHVPHPKTDRPVLMQGLLGVILEDGLPMYAINALQKAHYWSTTPRPMDFNAIMGDLHKKIRRPVYSVTVYEEIENPKALGSKRKRA